MAIAQSGGQTRRDTSRSAPAPRRSRSVALVRILAAHGAPLTWLPGLGQPSRRGASPPGSGALQIDRRHLALLAALDIEVQALTLAQVPHARPLDGRDVDEDVLGAVIGLDEAVSLGRVEPFD